MITYEEALNIAKYYRNDLTQVFEYEKAYVFSNSKDSAYIGGREHAAVVILKEDGTVTNMPALVYSGTGKEIGMRTIFR